MPYSAQFVPAPYCARAELVYLNDSQVMENVLHFRSTPGYTDTAKQTLLAGYIKDAWNTRIKPLTNSFCSLTKIKVTDISVQNGPGTEYTTGLPLAGTGAGNPAPNNVTVAIAWRTGYRGRAYRGRTYMVGLGQGQTLQSSLAAGLQTSFAAAWNSFMTDIELAGVADNVKMVIVSKIYNAVPRMTAVITDIYNCTVDNVLDSQRRRLPGRGK